MGVRMMGKKFQYRFVIDGKSFVGICDGCKTEAEAKSFERRIKTEAKTAALRSNPETATPAAIIAERNYQIAANSAKVTLDTAFDLYLQKPARRSASENQISRNRTFFADFVAFVNAKFPEVKTMDKITPAIANAYIDCLKTAGAFDSTVVMVRKGKKSEYKHSVNQLSNRTIEKRLKAIKAVFTRLQGEIGFLTNPFEITAQKKTTIKRDIFTQQEIDLILESATMPITKPLFLIGFHTGLALEDICNLQWSEIQGDFIVRDRAKTGAHTRIFIMQPLKAYLADLKHTSKYVSPELHDLYANHPSTLTDKARKFLQGLGIETTTIADNGRKISVKGTHAMRHTYAYICGKYGVPINLLQSSLGHLTQKMSQYYAAHSTAEDTKKAYAHVSIGSNSELPEDHLKNKIFAIVENIPADKLKSLYKMVAEYAIENEAF